MATSRYPVIQQHEPLRTPSSWASDERALVGQLTDIIDDLYSRFNRLRFEDFGKALQGRVIDTEGQVVDAKHISEGLMLTISGGAMVYKQPIEPTAPDYNPQPGDLWYDTLDDNRLYRFVEGDWKLMTAFESILDSLIIRSDTAPIDPTENSLWLDTSLTPNQFKQWKGDAWQTYTTRSFIVENDTFPTDGRMGDLAIKINEGNKLYRHDGAGWVAYQDQSITSLIAAAESMVLAISGGTHVFHGIDEPTSGMSKGDLWYDTANDNKCHRFDMTWQPISFTNTIETLDNLKGSLTTDDHIVTTILDSQLYKDALDNKVNVDDLLGYASKGYVDTQVSGGSALSKSDYETQIGNERTRAIAAEGAISAFTNLATPYMAFNTESPQWMSLFKGDYSLLLSATKLAHKYAGTDVAFMVGTTLFIKTTEIFNKLTISNDDPVVPPAQKKYCDIKISDNGISGSWRTV